MTTDRETVILAAIHDTPAALRTLHAVAAAADAGFDPADLAGYLRDAAEQVLDDHPLVLADVPTVLGMLAQLVAGMRAERLRGAAALN